MLVWDGGHPPQWEFVGRAQPEATNLNNLEVAQVGFDLHQRMELFFQMPVMGKAVVTIF